MRSTNDACPTGRYWRKTSPFVLLLLAGALSAQTPIVDLTTTPPPGSEKENAVVYVFGGGNFHNPPPKRLLPVQIELRQVSLPTDGSQVVLVELSIYNSDSKPYLLPVGRDAEAIFQPGLRERRQLRFHLITSGDEPVILARERTFGSLDLKGSTIPIPPSATVIVRYDSPLTHAEVERWKLQGKTEIVVAIEIADWVFEESPKGLTVNTSNAPTTRSRNTVKIQLE